MRKIRLFVYLLCLSFASAGQISLVGHTKLNNTPVKQVQVTVKADGVITKTLNTQSRADFKLQLDYGKTYNIYFQNPRSPVMYMQVLAAAVPPEKYQSQMGYELNIPFVYKTDDDIDTTVFREPFFKLLFDGNKRLTEDSAYNQAFARTVIRKPGRSGVQALQVKDTGPGSGAARASVEAETIIAGKVLLNGNPQLTVKSKAIFLVNQDGNVVRSSYTNRFGAFVFTGVTASQAGKIVLEIDGVTSDNYLSLVTSGNTTVTTARPSGSKCEWSLQPAEVSKLVNNHFTTNIGGKLISSNAREKKFYAKKDVYLYNQYHTLLKKTSTNLFGTFVFEDIKPDHKYYIVTEAKSSAVERVDLLSKEDNFIGTLDSLLEGRQAIRILSNYNKVFNDLSVDEEEMKMDIKATIYGDNVNTPIGRLKIILLNDNYEVIDSAMTDNFGTFKFKYLPFLKRFYLSAENTDNILDVFKNIIIYSNDDNLIKIMTHQKGSKFSYKPVNAEISGMRDLELDDPWLEFVDTKSSAPVQKRSFMAPKKTIVENILFETGKYDITPQAREILDKIILVLNTNKNLKIEVCAHTDSKGSEASNLKLSQMRARTVQDYISHAGIDVKRIFTKGYGESKLLNNCSDNQPCSELEHAQNRRIEFKILGE